MLLIIIIIIIIIFRLLFEMIIVGSRLLFLFIQLFDLEKHGEFFKKLAKLVKFNMKTNISRKFSHFFFEKK